MRTTVVNQVVLAGSGLVPVEAVWQLGQQALQSSAPSPGAYLELLSPPLLAGLMCCAVRRQTWISCFSSAGKESWGFSILQLQISTPTPSASSKNRKRAFMMQIFQGPNQNSCFLAFILCMMGTEDKADFEKLQWMWSNIISTLCVMNKFLSRHIKASTQILFPRPAYGTLSISVFAEVEAVNHGLPGPQGSFLQLSFPVYSTPHTPRVWIQLTHQIKQGYSPQITQWVNAQLVSFCSPS